MSDSLQNILWYIIQRLNWSYIIAAVIGYIVIRIAINLGGRVKSWCAKKLRQWRLGRAHPVQSSYTNVCLTLFDKEGKRAHYSKSNSFTFTRSTPSYVEILYSEGKIENVLSNTGTIKPEQVDFGYKHYRVEFATPYKRGEQADIIFSADMVDSFTAETEWWTHEVLYLTERLIIRIVLPQERPVTRFSIQKRDGNRWHVLKDQGRLVQEGPNNVIQVVLDTIEIGDLYKVEWSW